MNDKFILDTVENVRLINNSPQLRQATADFAKNLAVNRVFEIIGNEKLSKQEKDEKLWIFFIEYAMLEVQALRCGKENLAFPVYAFNDQFFDWLMTQRKEVSPWTFYIIAIASIYAGRSALESINRGELELPGIYHDLVEIAIAKNPRTQKFAEDLASISITDPGPVVFSDSEALQTLINSLSKYAAAKAPHILDTQGLAENLALMGAWEASLTLLGRSALELLNIAFAGKYLQNYLHKAIEKELAYEMRKGSKGKAKRKREGCEEVKESDLPQIKDDKGNEVSLMGQIPKIPQEDQEVMEMEAELFEALELTDIQKEILALKVERLRKNEIARRLDISRPTLNRHLKIIGEKIKNLQHYKLGISHLQKDTFRSTPTVRIPDPTAYEAITNIMQRNLLRLIE